jgi:hypothetical protein
VWRTISEFRRRPASVHEFFVCLFSSQDSFGQFYQETIHRQESKDSNAKSLPYSRYFHNKKIKYVWDAGILQFVKFRSVVRVV